jgi:hypothetical protein
MKYYMMLEKMIHAHNYFIWIFCHFPRNYEKSVLLANKRYQSPNFAVNWCMIWISIKICLKGAIKYSIFLNKKNMKEGLLRRRHVGGAVIPSSSLRSYLDEHQNIHYFITYFPWYQCDNTHVINFCVFWRHAFQRIKSIKTGMGW